MLLVSLVGGCLKLVPQVKHILEKNATLSLSVSLPVFILFDKIG